MNQTFEFAGLLFGNVDERGELDGDVCEEIKTSIPYLNERLSDLKEEILASDSEDFLEGSLFPSEDSTDYSKKPPNAVDYSNIKLEEEEKEESSSLNTTVEVKSAFSSSLLQEAMRSRTIAEKRDDLADSSSSKARSPPKAEGLSMMQISPENARVADSIGKKTVKFEGASQSVESDSTDGRDEIRALLPPTLGTLMNPELKLNKKDLTPELRTVCSSLNGKDGPILKYSEVFGPAPPSESVFYSRRKSKMDASKLDLEDLCEVDEEEDFDTPQEPHEYASVRQSSDMEIVEAEIGHPLKPDAKIESNLSEHAFALLEQQSWEDKIVWSSEGLEKQELSILARRSLHSQSKKKQAEASKPSVPIKEEPVSSLPDSMPVPALLRAQASLPKVITAPPEVKAEIKTHLFKPNDELESGKWVESIMWDDNVPAKVAPPIDLVLDLNDKYVFPDDPMKRFGNAPNVNISVSRRGRKRKFEPSEEGIDFFNLSNDKYYKTSGGKVRQKLGKTTVVHSVPALKLSIYKPFLSDHDLTHFHRPQAKIKPGTTYRVNIFRPEDAVTSGGAFQGQVKEMRHKGDLSSREGRVVLLEYIEENPLLLSNVGMGSKLKNYYRKRNPSEHPFLRHEDGENVFLDPSDPSPFLGEVEEGKTVHAVDNNLFIAPIAKHAVSSNDFLLVKIDNKFYIREIPAVYTVGQLQPKMEVYAPNSRAVSNYTKNRLQAYIYRLFMNKKVDQHRIRINEIVRLFPGSSEAVIRRKLKECADFQRGGDENGYWTVKDQSNMPSEEDVRSLVPPEQVCLHESMQAGQFRLNQNGIRKFTTITPAFTAALSMIDSDRNSDDKLRRSAHLLEEELLLTPWNLTSNFVGVVHEGKGMLQLTGLGDPSGGRGEGFSYLRMPIKNFDKKKKEDKPKVAVTNGC